MQVRYPCTWPVLVVTKAQLHGSTEHQAPSPWDPTVGLFLGPYSRPTVGVFLVLFLVRAEAVRSLNSTILWGS